MINKITLLILLSILLWPCFTSAQAKWTPKNRVYNTDIYFENNLKETNQKNQLKKKTIVSNKSFGTKEQFIEYDKEGRVVNYKITKGKEIKINYYSGDLKLEQSVYKNQKLVARDSFLWEDKKLMACFYFDNKNKLVEKESYKYDSTFVVEYVDSKVNGNKYKEKRKRIIEYYPDFSFKKITYYKNGKPDYYSVFDCNPIGENHKIKKDSSYNCVKYDVDSLGNKIKVTIVNDRLDPRKVIEYYNDKDELIAHKVYDLKKNQLELAYYFTPGAPLFTKFVSYFRKKEYYRIENVYDSNNKKNCIESATYKRRRLTQKTKNSFNEKEIIASSSEYNRRNKKKVERIYSYEYY